MQRPLLLPLLAVLLGIVGARFALPLPGVLPSASLVALYVAALVAFARCHRVFLPLVLVDVAWAAWLLAADADWRAMHPPLLDAVDVLRNTASGESSPKWQGPGSNVNGPSEGGPVMLEGVLRGDASRGTAGGATLGIDVLSLRTTQERTPADGGVIASVGGNLAATRFDEWRAGRRVRMPVLLRDPTVFRNPGLRDERVALARRDIHLFGSVKSGALIEVLREGSWWQERAADMRAFARRAIGEAVGRWSAQSAAIVIAILIGDRAGLSSEVERRLQEAGTYHVIAISGGNIAILAAFLLGLGRLAQVRLPIAACATIAVLIAYASLVGGGASVDRATLMAVTCLAALTFDLRGSPLNTLFAAASALLCTSPLSPYDIAFALTFGATLGILVASGSLGARMPRRAWLRAPAALFLASAAAELALLPVGAYAFYRVTFAGLILNFLAIPLMAVAELVGMLVLVIAIVDLRAATVAGFVAHLGAAGLVSTASLVDLMPFLTWRVPPPSGVVIASYYAAFLMWFGAPWVARRSRRPALVGAARVSALVMLAVSTISILWSPVARLRGSVATGLLRLTVIDVGQADAMLLRFPDARTMLVDAGGSRAGGAYDIGGRVIAPVLWNHDVFRLDRFVLSHGDPDHLGGAMALARAFRIGEMWEGVDVPRDAALQQLHGEIARLRVPARQVRAGERVSIGGADAIVWHPSAPDWERQKIRNDDSIVLEIRFGEVSLLLTGDIGLDVERPLARRLRVGRLCVMKVPHHGSTSSSGPALLAATRPAVAIFTVGPSALGTSSLQTVITRYRAIGADTVATGDDGAIEVETDGREVRVTTFTGRRLVLRPR